MRFLLFALRIAQLLFGCAASIGLILVLPYVNEMLFETRDGTIALMIFSSQIFWLSLILPLTAILQGAGKIKVPTLLLIGGFIVKVIGNHWLVSKLGVTGAALASNLGFIFVLLCLLVYFKTIWPMRLAPRRFYGWLSVATIAMIVTVLPWLLLSEGFLLAHLHPRISATITALTAVTLGALVFLFVVLKARIMKEKEWYLLPFGKRLAKIQLRLNRRKGE